MFAEVKQDSVLHWNQWNSVCARSKYYNWNICWPRNTCVS